MEPWPISLQHCQFITRHKHSQLCKVLAIKWHESQQEKQSCFLDEYVIHEMTIFQYSRSKSQVRDHRWLSTRTIPSSQHYQKLPSPHSTSMKEIGRLPGFVWHTHIREEPGMLHLDWDTKLISELSQCTGLPTSEESKDDFQDDI